MAADVAVEIMRGANDLTFAHADHDLPSFWFVTSTQVT